MFHTSVACLALHDSVLISSSITCCHKVFNLCTETEKHIPALQVSVFIIQSVSMFLSPALQGHCHVLSEIFLITNFLN
jgi:hypothetical protein